MSGSPLKGKLLNSNIAVTSLCSLLPRSMYFTSMNMSLVLLSLELLGVVAPVTSVTTVTPKTHQNTFISEFSCYFTLELEYLTCLTKLQSGKSERCRKTVTLSATAVDGPCFIGISLIYQGNYYQNMLSAILNSSIFYPLPVVKHYSLWRRVSFVIQYGDSFSCHWCYSTCHVLYPSCTYIYIISSGYTQAGIVCL